MTALTAGALSIALVGELAQLNYAGSTGGTPPYTYEFYRQASPPFGLITNIHNDAGQTGADSYLDAGSETGTVLYWVTTVDAASNSVTTPNITTTLTDFVASTFVASNGTPLDGYTDGNGVAWASIPGGNAGIAEIESNAVVASNTGAATCYANAAPATPDYSVTAKINIATALSAVACGPLARCSASANTYYAVAWDNGTLYLYSVVAGVLNVLASGALSLSTGTDYWLQIQVSGGTPTTIIASSSTDGTNFTEQLTYSDSSPITEAGFAGLGANTGISILNLTATELSTENVIAFNDANWWRTPLTYVVGLTEAVTNAFGNESRLKVGPTANGTLKVDCSNLTDTQTLEVLYSVDNGPWTQAVLTDSSTEIVMLSGGSSGTHTFQWKLQALTTTGTLDRWTSTPPGLSLIETGFSVDSGAATISWPPVPTKYLLSYGDSLCEGALINGDNSPPTQDATLAYSNHVAAALDANLILRGFGGGGWVAPNNGNVPPMFTPGNDTDSSWNKYFAEQSLLSGGTYTTQPDWILVGYGTNDSANSVATADVTASAAGWLAAARVAAPNAYIFIMQPFDLFNSSTTSGSAYVAALLAALGASPKSTAVDDMTIYQSATDSKMFVLNLGTNLAVGMYDDLPGATQQTNDGTHATIRQSGLAGARIVRLMQEAISGGGGGGGGGGNGNGSISLSF